MDSNQTAAIDSSGQLASNPINTGTQIHRTGGAGPINKLPNEIMLLVLGALKRKRYSEESNEDGLCYDAHKLVRLRLVSKRWNSLVEDFCRKQTVLNVNYTNFSDPVLKKSVPLVVHLKAISFLGKMLKLFPNIAQLAVCLWSSWIEFGKTQIHDFAKEINSLSSLKQLKLGGRILVALPHLTLSKLEHFEIDSDSDLSRIAKDHLIRFASELGPDCTVRVYLINDDVELNYDDIVQWHSNNPHFFAKVTHLQLDFHGEPADCVQFVHFLSENATSLQCLTFFADYDDHLEMSPNVVRDFGKLVHLTQLKLGNFGFNIARLEEAAAQHQLTSVASVLTCQLQSAFLRSDRRPIPWGSVSADQFARVLSVILPNLTELEIGLQGRCLGDGQFGDEIEQQLLERMPNLRKHKIVFYG